MKRAPTSPYLDLPSVTLKPHGQKRLERGHPWVYSNEVEMDADAKAVPPGGIVRLCDAQGRYRATAFFNRHPLIAARVLSRDESVLIDAAFLARRLARALAIRERLIGVPYYRLVHAEADGLPGVIIDRFGDALEENGARFFADLEGGQKTGWFYDQRDNRAWAARLARDGRVLDCYAFAGGFAVQAALAGATDVVSVDRSEGAHDRAPRAAEANGVAGRCRCLPAEVFEDQQRQSDSSQVRHAPPF